MSEDVLRRAFEKAMGFKIGHMEAKQIITAIHDDGYAITPMGSKMNAEVSINPGPNLYQKTIRARVQMTDNVCGAQFVVDEHMAQRADFCKRYLPRKLSHEIMSAYAGELERYISLVMEGVHD